MLIGLISDTHGYLPGRVFHEFAKVDCILHAGDVGDDAILDELDQIAPVHAVSGNTDGSPTTRRPYKYAGTIGSLKICMTHGHFLDPSEYNASAIRFFNGELPRLIVHGHSHRAKHEQLGGVSIINPGAACKPRFRDIPSIALVEVDPDGEFVCRFIRL